MPNSKTKTDNYKKILSENSKLKVATELLKDLITADEIGSSKGRSKEMIKEEVIVFINELID